MLLKLEETPVAKGESSNLHCFSRHLRNNCSEALHLSKSPDKLLQTPVM